MRLPFGAVTALLALLACFARDVHCVGGGGPGPPGAAAVPNCTTPEPAWQKSSWWPAGALFRCGCGFVSSGSASAWNDVAVCQALGDLLFATAGPQAAHMAVQQTVQPFNFYWANWKAAGWMDAVVNISTNYCTFDRVTCGVSLTGVTSAKGYGLTLSNNNLTGTLPASFSALTGLAFDLLDMAQLPNLTIDPAILVPFASTLTYLSMTGTKLAGGTLPPTLGSLTMMRILQAGLSGLTGTLPAELGSLSRLQSLTLSTNSITGGIPDSWSSLSALVTLYLDHNLLSGPLSNTALCAMKSLAYLDLSANSFSGSIPSLGSCNQALQLSYLDLKSNAFTGKLSCRVRFTCAR